jgi:plastocyanin
MKRVLVAGVVGGLMILGTPTLALSANRDNNGGGGHQSHDNRGSDNRGSHGHDSDHRGGGRDHDGRGGYYYGYPGYYDGYYGGYQDCYHDPSGYTTCEPYGGDYDPGGYNGGYPDPPPDQQYCSHRHSAHSAQCPEDQQPADNGGGPGGPGAAPAATVDIKGLAFNPADIKAQVGQPVVWHFDDNGTAHTVTADNGSFDSGKRASGDFQIAFPQPGTYSYHCSVHPKMKGTVAVS